MCCCYFDKLKELIMATKQETLDAIAAEKSAVDALRAKIAELEAKILDLQALIASTPEVPDDVVAAIRSIVEP